MSDWLKKYGFTFSYVLLQGILNFGGGEEEEGYMLLAKQTDAGVQRDITIRYSWLNLPRNIRSGEKKKEQHSILVVHCKNVCTFPRYL